MSQSKCLKIISIYNQQYEFSITPTDLIEWFSNDKVIEMIFKPEERRMIFKLLCSDQRRTSNAHEDFSQTAGERQRYCSNDQRTSERKRWFMTSRKRELLMALRMAWVGKEEFRQLAVMCATKSWVLIWDVEWRSHGLGEISHLLT